MDFLTVLTWNIRHLFGPEPQCQKWRGLLWPFAKYQERLQNITQTLITSKANIIVLQEVDLCSPWTWGILNQKKHFCNALQESGFEHSHFALSTSFPRSGVLILSKYPLADKETIHFYGRRQAPVATVNFNDFYFKIVGIHLDNRGAKYTIPSVQHLKQFTRQQLYPCVLVGDFNSSPHDFPNPISPNDLKKYYKDEKYPYTALDHLVDDGHFKCCHCLVNPPELPDDQKEMTFPTYDPRSIIDWILIEKNPAWRFLSCKVLTNAPYSDHLPVKAILTVKTL